MTLSFDVYAASFEVNDLSFVVYATSFEVNG